MVDRTADEAKKANIAAMGETLGSIYSALWEDFAITYAYWLEYFELYGTKPQRIELLNHAAPRFFRMVQDELWEVLLLHLTRITDPPSTGKKDNLSIQRLVAVTTDSKLRAEAEKAVDAALAATEFARDWRNRHIAHRDLDLALKQPATALADASRAGVKKALNAIAAVLNVYDTHYFKSETAFHLVPRHNGAEHLLYVLHPGVKAHGERRKRLEEGKPLESDFDPEDL